LAKAHKIRLGKEARKTPALLSACALGKGDENEPQTKESSIYWNSHYYSNGPFLAMARNSCNKK